MEAPKPETRPKPIIEFPRICQNCQKPGGTLRAVRMVIYVHDQRATPCDQASLIPAEPSIVPAS